MPNQPKDPKHTPGAMRAAEKIIDLIEECTSYQVDPNGPTKINLARIIDQETAAPELLEACKNTVEELMGCGAITKTVETLMSVISWRQCSNPYVPPSPRPGRSNEPL